MNQHALADAIHVLRKPRGVHIVPSLAAGMVKYEIWDRHGKMRFEGAMATEDFDADTVDLAWHWLESRDPTPPPTDPRAHLTLHGSAV